MGCLRCLDSATFGSVGALESFVWFPLEMVNLANKQALRVEPCPILQWTCTTHTKPLLQEIDSFSPGLQLGE